MTIKEAEANRRKWRQAIEDKRDNEDQVKKSLVEIRAEYAEVKSDLQHADSEHAQEVLADKLDELESYKHRLAERLKRIRKKIAHARDMREFFRKRVEELKSRVDRPSKNFSYAEFNCNNGVPIPNAAKPAIKHLCQNYLEPVRSKYGAVHINSGYRTTSYNASVGGASNSIHIYDQHPNAVAADITCANGSPWEVYNYLNSLQPGGLGSYSTFTHVDNRQRIGWPTSRWSG